ncbi:hypothetical protein D0Y65_005709 [Glycine soja]|uniref:Uncharacterized protein n=1 Tax=Glycine soja TaxID=3848 RepID=A0A445L622_GLYSO|nr:hypothetical protein D0Y65_005709 [Glycine soja]
MKERLTKIWKLSAGFDILDTCTGYFMVNFDIHRGRPMDNFISPAAKIEKTLVWMKDYRYQVQYKGLHQICGTYDCYNHLTNNISLDVVTNKKDISLINNDSPIHGDWVIVRRRKSN